jgi:hypothetical protein
LIFDKTGRLRFCYYEKYGDELDLEAIQWAIAEARKPFVAGIGSSANETSSIYNQENSSVAPPKIPARRYSGEHVKSDDIGGQSVADSYMTPSITTVETCYQNDSRHGTQPLCCVPPTRRIAELVKESLPATSLQPLCCVPRTLKLAEHENETALLTSPQPSSCLPPTRKLPEREKREIKKASRLMHFISIPLKNSLKLNDATPSSDHTRCDDQTGVDSTPSGRAPPSLPRRKVSNAGCAVAAIESSSGSNSTSVCETASHQSPGNPNSKPSDASPSTHDSESSGSNSRKVDPAATMRSPRMPTRKSSYIQAQESAIESSTESCRQPSETSTSTHMAPKMPSRKSSVIEAKRSNHEMINASQ